MRNSHLQSLIQLWTHFDLLGELVGRNLKLRYRRSFLGFFWSLLTPIYQIIIFTLVFKYIIGMEEENLSVKMLAALIPWTFFSVGITSACPSVLLFRDVVKKVYFPRQMLPIAVVIANLVHLLLSTLVLFLLFLIIPVTFSTHFFFIIVLIILQTFLVTGISIIATCAHTYYQDVEFILQNIMQVGMFLTPVVYTAQRATSRLPEPWDTVFMLNPMATFCEGWRQVLLEHTYPDPLFLGVAAAVSIAVFVIGLVVWQRYEWRFPEVL